MTRLTISKARDTFSDTLNRVACKGERIVLCRRGKDVVAIVPVEDLKFLEDIENRVDLDAAREALREAKSKGTTLWQKLKEDLGL